jgi:hypothetical protein
MFALAGKQPPDASTRGNPGRGPTVIDRNHDWLCQPGCVGDASTRITIQPPSIVCAMKGFSVFIGSRLRSVSAWPFIKRR